MDTMPNKPAAATESTAPVKGTMVQAPRWVPAHLDPEKQGYFDAVIKTESGHKRTITAPTLKELDATIAKETGGKK